MCALFIFSCNSFNKNFPDGLANSSGLVGKNLMLHPLGYVEGIFDYPLASNFGPQGCCIFSHQFYETMREREFKRRKKYLRLQSTIMGKRQVYIYSFCIQTNYILCL